MYLSPEDNVESAFDAVNVPLQLELSAADYGL